MPRESATWLRGAPLMRHVTSSGNANFEVEMFASCVGVAVTSSGTWVLAVVVQPRSGFLGILSKQLAPQYS